MKNTRIYLAAMAVAMLFVTSCKKEESSVKQEFSATMEVSKSGEKTNLVNDHLQWAHGSDQVSITSISGDTYITSTFTANTHTAYPNNLSYANLDLDQDQTELAEGEGVTYRSIYPASISRENNTQVILPRVQASTSGELTGYPMYAESSNKSLQFWNLCSVLKLSLTGTETISKIEVVTDKYINGTFTINYQNDNQPLSPTTATNHTKVTTLTMSSPVTLSSTASNFYIYLPVQQYKYIKINFYNQNNLVYSKAASITNGVNLERSRYHLIEFSTPAFKPSVLCGEFSVSSTKKVSFSKGNLLTVSYNPPSGSGNTRTSSGVYKFAAHQYDRRDDNVTDYTKWLFQWGYSAHSTEMATCWKSHTQTIRTGIFSNTTYTHTATLQDGGDIDWQCLSQSEWDYLLRHYSRISYYDKTGALQSSSTVNRCFTLGTVCGVNGMIIFPDIFYWPLDSKEPTRFGQGNYSSNWGGNNHSFNENEWIILEGAGCVFLPTTGASYNGSALDDNMSTHGHYWANNIRSNDEGTPYYLKYTYSATAFADNQVGNYSDYRAIRLVKVN